MLIANNLMVVCDHGLRGKDHDVCNGDLGVGNEDRGIKA